MLEHPRELLLDGVGAGAVGARVQVRAHLALRRERQALPLVVEQPDPHVAAVHRSLTARRPSTCCLSAAGRGPTRDFTVPTAHPTTSATSTSVRPSRSSRITLDLLGHHLAQPIELTQPWSAPLRRAPNHSTRWELPLALRNARVGESFPGNGRTPAALAGAKGGEAAMISRMTVAAVQLASRVLLGRCASGPMASADSVPSLAIPAEDHGMVFPELRGVVPQPAPRSAGETIQTQ